MTDTKRVLVLYAGTHGHTAKIADRVVEVLRRTGTSARARTVDTVRAADGPIDAYIIARSVHAGHHQHELVESISEHHAGRDIDLHHDTDYTDWDEVERFAEAFSASLAVASSHAER